MLYDSHGRLVNYLRLAVTDRCNLRCHYCMPVQGLDWLSRKDLMSYEEMHRICSIFVKMGVNKIRITGGEPFVRQGMAQFISSLSRIAGLETISVTTNGVLTGPYIRELKEAGVKNVNLSLDTLDRKRFLNITHRDQLPAVMATFFKLLEENIDVKINAVVMTDKNIDDIIPLAQLTQDLPISVRFIEEMPFNGKDNYYQQGHWNHVAILNHLTSAYPAIYKIKDPPYSTAYNYQIPGHKGTLGVIAAYTRSFCGSCNRVRLTPDGSFRTCLYEAGGLNIKDLIRIGRTDDEIGSEILLMLSNKSRDGWEAEKMRPAQHVLNESMAAIGG